MKRAERSMVLGANWRLTKAKKSSTWSTKTTRAPHAWTKYRTDGEKEQRTSNITPPAKLFCERLHIFVGRAVFSISSFKFGEHSELYKCSTTCWLQSTLSACLRCRVLIGTYLLCCLCGLTALCCAVLCCLRSKESKEIRKVPQQIKLSSAITG